jgi:hypothetical protein
MALRWNRRGVTSVYSTRRRRGLWLGGARHRQQDRDSSGHQRRHVHADERYRPGCQSRHCCGAERRVFAPGSTVHNSGSLKAAAGGEIVLSGTVANGSAGVILASGASARVDLSGATISGGKLQTLSGGMIETAGGAPTTCSAAARPWPGRFSKSRMGPS